MSQSNRTAAFEAARQKLAQPPSYIGVDWMGGALSQMAAPLRHAGSPLVNRMFDSMGTLPTALLGVGV